MQNILFIGTDFQQYLRLKSTLTQFSCTYSVSLTEGVKQFNQRDFCLIVLNLSLISANTGQEELLRSFRRAHPLPIIALCADVSDSDTVRLLDAGADQILLIQTPDEVLAAYVRALIYRYTTLDRIDRDHCHQLKKSLLGIPRLRARPRACSPWILLNAQDFAPCGARPKGAALWKPAAFEKAGETFSCASRLS